MVLRLCRASGLISIGSRALQPTLGRVLHDGIGARLPGECRPRALDDRRRQALSHPQQQGPCSTAREHPEVTMDGPFGLVVEAEIAWYEDEDRLGSACRGVLVEVGL